MISEFTLDSATNDLQPVGSRETWSPGIDVPTHLERLPDGRDSLVIGDPQHFKDFELQGDNTLGFRGTCGIVSCEEILAQHGVHVSENDLVHHAVEHRPPECSFGCVEQKFNGGTTTEQREQILADYGVFSRSEDQQATEPIADYVERVAGFVEQGDGVILRVNAGILWEKPGQNLDADYYEGGSLNHAIVITGIARDPLTQSLQGFFINDSGSGQFGQFVDVEKMETACHPEATSPLDSCVVTDSVIA